MRGHYARAAAFVGRMRQRPRTRTRDHTVTRHGPLQASLDLVSDLVASTNVRPPGGICACLAGARSSCVSVRATGTALAAALRAAAMWKPASVAAVCVVVLAVLAMHVTRKPDVVLKSGLRPVPVYVLQVPVKDLAMRYLGMSKVRRPCSEPPHSYARSLVAAAHHQGLAGGLESASHFQKHRHLGAPAIACERRRG